MALSLKPLSEQTIVITGASSGIGLATALAAAAGGAQVVLAARNEEALAEAVRKIEAKGGKAVYVVADVSQRDQVERIARTAIERYGGFTTWVNDAGLGLWGRLEELSDEDSRQLFNVNFWGTVYGSLVAVRHLKRRGGALINLGSVASDFAFPIQGMYSATKHAVKAYTNALRRELQDEGAPISITLIKPAAIGTPFHEHAKNYTDQATKLPPPVYDPEEVATAILYAAQHPRRELHVGGAGKLISAVGKLAPGLADAGASMLIKSQLRKQPPGQRQGSLHHPSQDEPRLRGDHPGQWIRPSAYTRGAVNPVLTGTLIAAGTVVVGLLGRKYMKS